MSTESPGIDSLVFRVAKLEKRVRWFGFLVAICSLVILGLLLAALRAAGQTVVTHTVLTGSLVLRVPSETQFTSGALAAGADGASSLAFIDSGSKYRGSFGIESTGRPSIEFYDKHGTKRAWLGLGTDDQPVLEFTDEKGKTIWKLASAGLTQGSDAPAPPRPEESGKKQGK